MSDDRATRLRNHVFDMEKALEDARAATAVLDDLLCGIQDQGSGEHLNAAAYLIRMLNRHLADTRAQWEATFNLVMEDVRHDA